MEEKSDTPPTPAEPLRSDPAAEKALAALIAEDSFRPGPEDQVLLPGGAEPPADAFSLAGAAQRLRTAAEAIRRGHEQDSANYGDRHVLVRAGDLDALLAALRRMETAELLSQVPATGPRRLQECPR